MPQPALPLNIIPVPTQDTSVNPVSKNLQTTHPGSSHWGYHLIYNAGGCNDLIFSEETIRLFVNELVKEIDMVAVGECHITHLLDGTYNSGYSVLQLIETSNVTIHFVELPRTCYLDVFSCKSFDYKKAIDVFEKYFNPKAATIQFLTRHAPIC